MLPARASVTLRVACCLRNTKTSISVPGLVGFSSLFGFTALKVSELGFGYLDWGALVPISPFLHGQNFDPETTRLMGVAFESARAAIKRPGDLTDEMIAKKIIELANAGERDVEALGEAALNVPTE